MNRIFLSALLVAGGSALGAQNPVRDVRYTVSVDSALLARHTIKVSMSFAVSSAAPVVLSLPAWTPGHYQLMNFARNVAAFTATESGAALRWNNVDYDSWRVQPVAAGVVIVAFDYRADGNDNNNASSMTWPDMAVFNGTNVFLYPEGQRLDVAAVVTIVAPPEWRVATGMHPGDALHSYREGSYHDLVDMPVFVGRFDIDSARINDRWTRFASYPVGAFSGAARDSLVNRMSRVIPVEAAVMGETPWSDYTVFLRFDSAGSGYGALEHQSSNLGRYGMDLVKSPANATVAGVVSHEIFHAWNVKRLRPAEMTPYRYDRPQPTPWLWVSEGITDYYSDLAMVRARVVDSAAFAAQIAGKISFVSTAPPTALTDASLNTWISPRDGSDQVYYPKGSLAGLMLDIFIRDASDNRRSLDDVMRAVYTSTYKQHRGFTTSDWWSAVSKAAGGRSFKEFEARYVMGRDAFPWDSVLPLAGLRYVVSTIHQARLGTTTVTDSLGQRVQSVVQGGTADRAHVEAGDHLVSVGGIAVHDASWVNAFRLQFNGRKGAPLEIVVRRAGQNVALSAVLNTVDVVEKTVEFDRQAPPKAARIRHALLSGQP